MAVQMRDLMRGVLPELRVHPVDKWVRARAGDTLVVSTGRPRLVWEPRRVVPSYAVPRDDVAGDLVPVVDPDVAPVEHPVPLGAGPPVLDAAGPADASWARPVASAGQKGEPRCPPRSGSSPWA